MGWPSRLFAVEVKESMSHFEGTARAQAEDMIKHMDEVVWCLQV